MPGPEDSEDPQIDALLSGARAIGVHLDGPAARRLLIYLDAVLEANQRINVTGIRERGDAVVRHLVDSLSAVALWHELTGPPAPARVLDLGTGGGFPGAPMAVAWPKSRVFLVDGTGKKIQLVTECLAEAGIENAEPVWARGADLPKAQPDMVRSFDLCVARAVGQADALLHELAPLTTRGGYVFLMKGPEPPPDEVAAADREAKRRKLRVLPARKTHVPGLDARTVLIYRATR